jgi:hypothetical protein
VVDVEARVQLRCGVVPRVEEVAPVRDDVLVPVRQVDLPLGRVRLSESSACTPTRAKSRDTHDLVEHGGVPARGRLGRQARHLRVAEPERLLVHNGEVRDRSLLASDRGRVHAVVDQETLKRKRKDRLLRRRRRKDPVRNVRDVEACIQ